MTDFLVEEHLGYCQTPGCKGVGQLVNEMCQECRLGFNESLGQFFKLGKAGDEKAGRCLVGVRGTLKHFMSDQVVGVIASNLANFKNLEGFQAWMKSGSIAGITSENYSELYKVAKGRWISKSKMFAHPTYCKKVGFQRKIGDVTSVPDAPPTEKEKRELRAAHAKHDAEQTSQTGEGKKMTSKEEQTPEIEFVEPKIPAPPKAEQAGVEISEDAPAVTGAPIPIPAEVLGRGGAEVKEKAPKKGSKRFMGTKVVSTKIKSTKI